MTNKTITISCDPLDSPPIRIDKFLLHKFPDYSRSYFQQLIKDGLVHVNDKAITKNSHLVEENDSLAVTFTAPKGYNVQPLDVAFDIIDVQPDFIIINKPAGLIVHPAPSSSEISLVSGLLYRFAEFHDFDDSQRPGIVHRLDRDTSGIMIVARNLPAQIKIAQLFKDRQMSKTYLALVKGHPDKEGKIDFSIGRHKIHRHKMSHQGISSRSAKTYFEVLKYYEESSLVAAKPITGRTHQIRVHLAAIGHGILGDLTYGHESKLIKRQALHAWKLSFEYKGTQYSYHAPVPEDFGQALKHSLLNTIPHKKK